MPVDEKGFHQRNNCQKACQGTDWWQGAKREEHLVGFEAQAEKKLDSSHGFEPETSSIMLSKAVKQQSIKKLVDALQTWYTTDHWPLITSITLTPSRKTNATVCLVDSATKGRIKNNACNAHCRSLISLISLISLGLPFVVLQARYCFVLRNSSHQPGNDTFSV